MDTGDSEYNLNRKIFVGNVSYRVSNRLATVSNVNFCSKTDNLSKIAIYNLYLE